MLGLLGIRGWFAHAQIYHDATKKTHLGAILRASGVPTHAVLFFDDEPRNVKGACVRTYVCLRYSTGFRLRFRWLVGRLLTFVIHV